MPVTLNMIPATLQEFQAGKHLRHVPVCITAIHKGQGCRGGGNEYAAGSQTHDSL